jgi:hypothetical protein
MKTSHVLYALEVKSIYWLNISFILLNLYLGTRYIMHIIAFIEKVNWIDKNDIETVFNNLGKLFFDNDI